MSYIPTPASKSGATGIPADVLDLLGQAIIGLKGLSGEQENPDRNPDHDPLDDPDLSWTGGRYDHQAQREFILKMVLHYSGYKHDPKLSPEQRRKERLRILNHRDTQHRRVFSMWPASDKLKANFNPLRDNPKGLGPPNAPAMWGGPGIWGATLFDHYNLMIVEGTLFPTSGSKMFKWCVENGDSVAASEMAWAMTEPEPELIEPCDIGELIVTMEDRKRMFGGMFELSPTSPVDFPPLQEYFSQHLLPETLVVEDPDKLLYTSGKKGGSTQQRYKLKFSDEYDARRKEDILRASEVAAEDEKIRNAFLADPHTRNELPDGTMFTVLPQGVNEAEGPIAMKFFYVQPLHPGRVPIKEAQLRFSKKQLLGTGNHSFVYDAHFVLPRSTFFDAQICDACIADDIQQQISAYDFPESFFDEKPGKMVLKTAIKKEPRFSKATPAPLPHTEEVLMYEGPLVVLHSKLQYSDEPCAKHREYEPPATATVRVVAKLSKQHDLHLAREAENYQRFPRHLFEHWSGLIKVPGIRNPVPAGPVVPQFYGYYVPEMDEASLEAQQSEADPKDKDAGDTPPFLSPILLLENCGKPIEPETYGHDDTQECCSLIYRLRQAGFYHASVAKRNIVAQQGPLSAWPFERMLLPGSTEFDIKNPYGGPSGQSFRLIDFGRTAHVDALDERALGALFLSDHERVKKWANGREMLH